MYDIFLDNLRIDESLISDLGGITITRSLNEYYFGYLNGQGFADSSSDDFSVTIEDPIAVAYLKAKIANGFDSKVVLSTGIGDSSDKFLVDFTGYKETGCCTVSVNLKPNNDGVDILTNEKVKYTLDFDEEITMPYRPYVEDGTLSIFGSIESDTATLNHSIPIEKSVSEVGEFYDVAVSDRKAFWIANKDGCFNINMAITFDAEVSTDSIATIVLSKNGQEIFTDDYNITTQLSDYNIALNQNIDVKKGDEFELYFKGTNNGNDFKFDYKDSSFLGISSCDSPSETETISVKAISIKSAVSLILNKINSNLVLDKYIFDSEIFEGYLTNSLGLKGEDSFINISLYDLFEEINNKYPASLSEKDGRVDLVSRECFINDLPLFSLPYEAESREIFTEYLVKTVKVGYNNWRDTTSLGFLEINADREFVSTSSIEGNDLSILNDVSGSQTLMQEEYDKDTTATNNLFWIHVIKSSKKAETSEYIKTNIFSDNIAINKRITPYRNAKRWSKFILNNIKFASGEGNYNLKGQDTYSSKIDKPLLWSETDAIESNSIFDGFTYSVPFNECYGIANIINGKVSFNYCGEKKFGLLKEINYNNDKFGRNSVDLVLIGIR